MFLAYSFFVFNVFADSNVFADNSEILIILAPPSGRDTGQNIRAVGKKRMDQTRE